MVFQKEIVNTDKAPAPVGAYNQATKAGGFLFVSGQIPLHPETGELVVENFEDEARLVFSNLKAVIEAGGSSLEKTMKVTVFLTDMGQFSVVNGIYSEFFKAPFPARAVVEVSGLPKGVHVEAEAVCLV